MCKKKERLRWNLSTKIAGSGCRGMNTVPKEEKKLQWARRCDTARAKPAGPGLPWDSMDTPWKEVMSKKRWPSEKVGGAGLAKLISKKYQSLGSSSSKGFTTGFCIKNEKSHGVETCLIISSYFSNSLDKLNPLWSNGYLNGIDLTAIAQNKLWETTGKETMK